MDLNGLIMSRIQACEKLPSQGVMMTIYLNGTKVNNASKSGTYNKCVHTCLGSVVIYMDVVEPSSSLLLLI